MCVCFYCCVPKLFLCDLYFLRLEIVCWNEPNSLRPYPYNQNLRAEMCLRTLKKHKDLGTRPCLPLPERDSVGRSRRESHRKRGWGVGPLSGSRFPELCSFGSSLSQFVVNCNSVQNMPTITFIISGSQFPLPPSAYVLNVRIHSQDPGKCHWLNPEQLTSGQPRGIPGGRAEFRDPHGCRGL